ncbi:hypothetical protein SNOG_06662 [Parastagonospora nodorum SN15]|uniref:Stress-response A/B barrel domain-containing protein n=1 Tax=Phaeosphaeria nodorum (strain SN15 / ATCC MYA-4574 / FGSC 10173) TaxID=321614 RepID=Q0UNK2_PHANO|nr:hypothetical protein SNOG_06662 [Parastagonospora nodorum SN15]EAT86493.1 hypothetical protein SNOG_06662 [Parastagonospora nodorum SN15]
MAASAQGKQLVAKRHEAASPQLQRDGNPYVQMAAANPSHDDPRSQGYTLVARTVFECKEDMDFYDNECEAHKAIKAVLKPVVAAPPLVVYMDAQFEKVS